jgi:hypothetical protein
MRETGTGQQVAHLLDCYMMMMMMMMNNTNAQFSKAHVTTLNLSNFKIIEAIKLKLLHRGSLEWHYLRNKFIKIYQAVEKLLVGNSQTDG